MSCVSAKTRALRKSERMERMTDSRGYIKVWDGNRKVGEHVLIAERALGRRLKKGELAHHINLKRCDNRNGNLLLTTTGEHWALHERMATYYIERHPEFVGTRQQAQELFVSTYIQ